MNRSLPVQVLLLVALFLAVASGTAQVHAAPIHAAQLAAGPDGTRPDGARPLSAAALPRPVTDSTLRHAARELVDGFLREAIGRQQGADSLLRFSTSKFAEFLMSRGKDTIWPVAPASYRVGEIYQIRDSGTALMATLSTENGTVPRFGALEIDWVLFLEPGPTGDLRISALRRMSGVDDNAAQLRYLDTSSVYPEALKPTIAYEESAILLSNRQIRQHFLEHRAAFNQLLGQFSRKDSLKVLGRVDRKVSMLNRYSIEWGPASHDIPKDVIEGYLKGLPKDKRPAVEKELRLTESVRRSGYDTLAQIVRKSKLSLARIDTVIGLMKDLRVSFVNRSLPWTDAVQFTVAGRFGNAVGYLYSPYGQVPLVDPMEYYYLEEIGDGWWIFRST